MVEGMWGDVVVGLAGFPKSGKDTIAQLLVSDFGFTRAAFGDGVKQLLLSADPAYRDSLHYLELCKRDPADPNSTRDKLQRLGQACRTLESKFWVNFLRDSGAVPDQGPVVITDIRYENELMWVREGEDFPGARNSGVIFGVHREGCGPVNDHESETNTFDILASCDFHIHNDGTPDDAVETLLNFLQDCVQ